MYSGYGFPASENPVVTPRTAAKIVLNPNAPTPGTHKKKDGPKAQRKGLSDNDFKAIVIALNKLVGFSSRSFRRLVADVL